MGRTVADAAAARLSLTGFPTPLLTLSAPGLRHNITTMAGWCDERGLDLAPHGKTTMAPQLWADQLAAGAWAITVANAAQLAVASAFGVSRVLVANAVLAPAALRWMAGQLAADDHAQLICWADDVRTVQLMETALVDAARSSGASYRPLDVLVEVGGPDARTGARDLATAVGVAEAIVAAPHLRLVGVAGYEGARR